MINYNIYLLGLHDKNLGRRILIVRMRCLFLKYVSHYPNYDGE